MQRLPQEGYIAPAPDLEAERQRRAEPGAGGTGEAMQTRFEVTDKSIDFLGYRALRDLLGSIGRSSFGRHDTRELETGVETSGVAKQYEWGDTLNLDPSATLLSAVQRAGPSLVRGGVIDVDYEDLMVVQASTRARAQRC